MADLQRLFAQTEALFITHKGQTLYSAHHFPVEAQSNLRLTFEAGISDWQQGVMLSSDVWIVCEGVRVKNNKWLVLWRTTAPDVICFTVTSKRRTLIVSNCWDNGCGATHHGMGGAAMLVEQIPSGFRYFCNDSHSDELFDDLVFKIECV